MDPVVDSLEKAYEEFLTALTILLETRETNGGEKPEGVDPYLESFQKHLVSFKATCDEAEGFVEYLKHSLGCEKFPEHVSDSDPIPMKTDDEKTSKTDTSTSKS